MKEELRHAQKDVAALSKVNAWKSNPYVKVVCNRCYNTRLSFPPRIRSI